MSRALFLASLKTGEKKRKKGSTKGKKRSGRDRCRRIVIAKKADTYLNTLVCPIDKTNRMLLALKIAFQGKRVERIRKNRR